MLYIILMVSLLISMNIIKMKHPLIMGFLLIIQTLLISLITGFINNLFWFSYILFIIMIGGMMILFIYMTSLASNEKYYFSSSFFFSNFFLLSMMIMLLIIIDPFYFNYINLNNEKSIILNLNKLYNLNSKNITLITIIYLLFTLITVIKITNKNLGPLRQKN
uniref:NADH dehydrogenase subunit 6 n=1 Tax=Inocellia fulvostigmata TaxID=3018577 RepID=UPI0022FD51FA|nr:NADH dehydrogenase subunit 6 [Inocellia fulvostigmata]WBK02768.1 NADH dehydrogenase subunit 6 [Inocellia fulvostigmata]